MFKDILKIIWLRKQFCKNFNLKKWLSWYRKELEIEKEYADCYQEGDLECIINLKKKKTK